MPPSPLKRPSGGGGGGSRLRRLLASLRPPGRAGPLPVQTGFPTSLADIVVKHHGRLRKPRRQRHRADPGAAAVSPPAVAAEPQQRRGELSVARHDAAAPAPATVTAARLGKGTGFSIRPGLLAATVALALLVVWSKQLVAAATLASVALSWVESVRRSDRWPIREAAESPRPCESESGDGDSDAASSRWSADDASSDLGGRDDTSSPAPVSSLNLRKQSRRSLRKLLASKLRNGKRARGATADCSRHGVDAGEHGEADDAESAPSSAGAPADDDRCESNRRRSGSALPLPALVPIIMAGLVAGKVPAVALAVLCAAFSSSVERVPAGQGRAAGK